MSDDAGEMYLDVVKGEVRRRRGHTGRLRRGPYSWEEAAMIDAFDKLLSAERRMHGVLAQPTCVDVTVLLTSLRSVIERWSYENVPDVRGVDPHVVFDELDMEVPESPVGDQDIYGDLQ